MNGKDSDSKFLSLFGRHLISIGIHPSKEVRYYVYSLRVKDLMPVLLRHLMLTYRHKIPPTLRTQLPTCQRLLILQMPPHQGKPYY